MAARKDKKKKQDVVRVRSNPKESISKHPQSQKRSGFFRKSKSKIYNIKISITQKGRECVPHPTFPKGGLGRTAGQQWKKARPNPSRTSAKSYRSSSRGTWCPDSCSLVDCSQQALLQAGSTLRLTSLSKCPLFLALPTSWSLHCRFSSKSFALSLATFALTVPFIAGFAGFPSTSGCTLDPVLLRLPLPESVTPASSTLCHGLGSGLHLWCPRDFQLPTEEMLGSLPF